MKTETEAEAEVEDKKLKVKTKRKPKLKPKLKPKPKMKFFIVRPFKYNGKTYSRRDKYMEMPYEDARPFIRRRKLMLSKTQEEQKHEITKKSPKENTGVQSGSTPVRRRKSSVRPLKAV